MRLGLYLAGNAIYRGKGKRQRLIRAAQTPSVELIDMDTGEVLGTPNTAEIKGGERRAIDVTNWDDDAPKFCYSEPSPATVRIEFTVGQNIALIA